MKYNFLIITLILLSQLSIVNSHINDPYEQYFPETTLKPMEEFNRETEILYPENALSYITPENEVVQWYAENTILTDYGLIWKLTKKPVKFNYKSDNELFNNPPSGDMWQNPDYYLTHNRTGDCEDFSVAFISILKAKGISAELVGVKLINDKLHWVPRYHFNNHTAFADINKNNVIIFHDIYPMSSEEIIVIGES